MSESESTDRSVGAHHIVHDLYIRTEGARVFGAVSTSSGLDEWWTKRSSGNPAVGNTYELWFGPEYDWRGNVARCEPGKHFEIEITSATDDWVGTRVRFELEEQGEGTSLRFAHLGWKAESEHFRVSSYCWATYLRILKRYLEHGERVPYELRDDA